MCMNVIPERALYTYPPVFSLSRGLKYIHSYFYDKQQLMIF